MEIQMTQPDIAVVMANATIDPLLPFVKSVENYIGISRSGAYRLIDAGRLKIVKIGRRTLIRQSEIARFIAEAEGPAA
jgi:excisionase family DNA binding protein